MPLHEELRNLLESISEENEEDFETSKSQRVADLFLAVDAVLPMLGEKSSGALIVAVGIMCCEGEADCINKAKSSDSTDDNKRATDETSKPQRGEKT